MVNDKLDEIFDIEPISETKDAELITYEPQQVPDPISSEEKLNQDIDNVRETQYHLMKVGKEVLDDLVVVARQSESARAYEVLAGLIKTTSEVAQSLADTSIERHKTLAVKEKKSEGDTVTNNILFTGSTAELQKFLKQKREEVND
jgi:hypothetical protein